MAKLNIFEKEVYSLNMEIAGEDKIAFAQSEDKQITVAVKRNDTMQNFLRVYVAYCGNETPKKKRGINAVMNRYFNDNFILVPVHFGHTDEDMAYTVLSIIEDSYFQ